jgi:hypothetical protein
MDAIVSGNRNADGDYRSPHHYAFEKIGDDRLPGLEHAPDQGNVLGIGGRKGSAEGEQRIQELLTRTVADGNRIAGHIQDRVPGLLVERCQVASGKQRRLGENL